MDRINELNQMIDESVQAFKAYKAEGKAEEAKQAFNAVQDYQMERAILETERAQAENSVKEAEIKNEWKSAGEFFNAVVKADSRHGRDERLFRNTAAGSNEGTNADGGYLVPPEYAQEIIKGVMTQTVLADKVRKINVSSNQLNIPYVAETSRVDGSRWGGVQAYWKAEAAQYTSSKPAFGELQIPVDKLTALAYATDELLEDREAAAAIIVEGAINEMAFKLDDGIINGAGSGAPVGILNSGNTALVTATGAASWTENILSMWNRMMPRNRANAVWVINQDIETELIKMYFTTGSASGAMAFLPAGGLSGQPYHTLMGRPIIVAEQAAASGSVGDIILVDPTQYALVERGGLKQATSIHVKFDTDETAFKFTWRIGGKPMVASAITPYTGSTTRSPYVVLSATRS